MNLEKIRNLNFDIILKLGSAITFIACLIMLFLLKLLGIIELSWMWILSPIFGIIGTFIVIFLILMIIVIVDILKNGVDLIEDGDNKK